MSNLEIIQNCQICSEQSLKRGFIIRHTFKTCDKCTQAMEFLKKDTDVSEWDKPWYNPGWVEPKVK